MELENFQKIWKELNERICEKELVHQGQIREMLSRQKESCQQKIVRLTKASLTIIVGIFILLFVEFFRLNGSLRFLPVLLIAFLFVLVVHLVEIRFLKTIGAETNLEKQIKNVQRYKSFTKWTYIVGFVLLIPFFLVFTYLYHSYWILFGVLLWRWLIDRSLWDF